MTLNTDNGLCVPKSLRPCVPKTLRPCDPASQKKKNNKLNK